MRRVMSMLGVMVSTSLVAWNYMPFDDAMKRDFFPRSFTATEQIVGIDGQELYDFFKDLYDRNNLSVIGENEEHIPKIIHQIWLGSPLPDAFIELQESWIHHHLGREWRYKLWTDDDVAQIQLYNQEFYDATDNFGVKSDILRWEIVYTYGGIYVDTDAECLRSFDELLVYDFFTGLQPLDTFFVQLGAAVFGAVPGHPILKHCIETIREDWSLQGAPKKTGPVHFTKSFYAMAGKNGMKDIALPAYYFYPLGSQDKVVNKGEWLANDAYAVHWWAKSWMPKQYRAPRFKDINNDASTESWNN